MDARVPVVCACTRLRPPATETPCPDCRGRGFVWVTPRPKEPDMPLPFWPASSPPPRADHPPDEVNP